MSSFEEVAGTRRAALVGAATLLAGLAAEALAPAKAEAKDYTSRREALDDLDRLSSICGMRLGTVGRARAGASLLVSRFLTTLERHRATREDVRRRFALPRGVDPAGQLGEVDADLEALRQSLDDLMIAHAESLPVFGDATVVSRLAVNMVEVSKLRTVIDLWVVAEAS